MINSNGNQYVPMEMTLMLELSDKDFKVAIICRFHMVCGHTLETNGKIEVLRRKAEIANENFRNENYI